MPPGGVCDLLFLSVEGHFDVRKGGVVHGSFSLRRSPDSSSERHHFARLRGRHQVLFEPKF